jgi:pimeloyl-ACP methyl ester carboxylesterase
METKLLNIEGQKLVAICLNPEAQGEPVILIHGITGSISSWTVNPLPFILEQGPCYALSLPWHFPAAFPKNFLQEQITAEMMARVMTEAIRQLIGDRPATLMGHSTGGFAALNIAAHYPALVRRVISVSGFAHGRWIGFLGFYQRLVRMGGAGRFLFKMIYRMAGINPAVFRAVFKIYAADSKALYANPDVDEAIGKTLPDFQQLNLDSMAQYFHAMPDVDITPLLARIQCPALVITGDLDTTVPPSESRKIAASLPNAELALIQGAGHLPFLERPVEYQKALRTWLEKTR